jgi:hypothetical protein
LKGWNGRQLVIVHAISSWKRCRSVAIWNVSLGVAEPSKLK